jgi:hypothetical protein
MTLMLSCVIMDTVITTEVNKLRLNQVKRANHGTWIVQPTQGH